MSEQVPAPVDPNMRQGMHEFFSDAGSAVVTPEQPTQEGEFDFDPGQGTVPALEHPKAHAPVVAPRAKELSADDAADPTVWTQSEPKYWQ